jgi:K+-sensing histidine kinase KdpD
VRYGLDAATGFSQPFILFDPTIIVVVLLAGFGPGLFATFLSGAIAEYFFVQPAKSFMVWKPRDIVALVLFSLVGTAISGLGETFRRRTKR